MTTRRLALRPWSEDDRSHFAELATDPVVVRYIGDGSTWSRVRTDDVFERQLRHWKEHGFGWRAAVLRETSEWVGFLGLNHVGPEATEITGDEIEIGWWLRPDAWGRGLATEGAMALRDEGFSRVGLDRIIGRYQPDNVASGRIMETLGMTVERDATGRHGEAIRIYALSREQWSRGVTA
ncbi:MAG: GNAT family N-acetyltransferase [Actinomycetota bacterium]|nr:GNAT family N-acetyltransferase [Actinomycetota bacterium]